MRVSRRRFLERGSGLALATAFAARSPFGIGQMVPACPEPSALRLPLGIDIHTHIFNGRDLPVARFLRQVVAQEGPHYAAVLLPFAGTLERMVDQESPTAEQEIKRLDRLLEIQKAQPERTLEDLLAEDAATADRVYYRLLAEELKNDPEFRNLYLKELQKRFDGLKAKGDPLGRLKALNENDVRILGTTQPLSGEQIQRLLQIEVEVGGLQVLNWGKIFTRYRSLNARELLLTYRAFNALVLTGRSCTLGAIDLFAPAILDLDYWLGWGSRKPTPLEMQIEVMERIIRLSGGRMHSFSAFDPRRHFSEGERSLRLVKDALEKGFVGVKIYPPMGFAPFGNTGRKRPEKWSDGDFPKQMAQLDKAMTQFFEFCEGMQVPILAHANFSYGSRREYRELAGPLYWAKALDKYRGLNVCFGHFGGEEGLTGNNRSRNWQHGFVDLMKKHDHVYADTSYFAGILDPDRQPAMTAGLKTLFDRGGERVASRMLYGSDWLMIALESGWDRYYGEFRAAIRRIEGTNRKLSEQFFGGNALNFLGFPSKGRNYARTKDYYAKVGKNMPQWLRAI